MSGHSNPSLDEVRGRMGARGMVNPGDVAPAPTLARDQEQVSSCRGSCSLMCGSSRVLIAVTLGQPSPPRNTKDRSLLSLRHRAPKPRVACKPLRRPRVVACVGEKLGSGILAVVLLSCHRSLGVLAKSELDKGLSRSEGAARELRAEGGGGARLEDDLGLKRRPRRLTEHVPGT